MVDSGWVYLWMNLFWWWRDDAGEFCGMRWEKIKNKENGEMKKCEEEKNLFDMTLSNSWNREEDDKIHNNSFNFSFFFLPPLYVKERRVRAKE